MGPCWHLSTPEDYTIIFRDELDFKTGMTLLAVCAMLSPGVKIITFELMSNHIHIIFAGEEDAGKHLFALFRKLLSKHLLNRYGVLQLVGWDGQTKPVKDMEYFRTAVAYDNRNGYLVQPDHTPFSYPWGANRFFFNPDARRRFLEQAVPCSFRERRMVCHSHIADHLSNLMMVDGYASPLCFCAIEEAEGCFRDAHHYFYKISRDVESHKMISRELGERVFYTDEELYAITYSWCKERSDCASPTLLPAEAKLEAAKWLRYEYNAGEKQIVRLLKLEPSLVAALFGR